MTDRIDAVEREEDEGEGAIREHGEVARVADLEPLRREAAPAAFDHRRGVVDADVVGAEHPHEAQQPEPLDIASMNRKNMRAA